MNRMLSGKFALMALLASSPGLLNAQDDFDKLLKEIGGTPAAQTPAATPAAAPVEAAPVAPAPAAEAPESDEDRRKAREARGDIKAALAPPDEKTLGDAKLMAQQEEVRKQALEVQARKSLDKGVKAIRAGELDSGIKQIEEAVRNMPKRPTTESILEGAKTTLGQAYLQRANNIIEAAKKKPELDARRDMDAALEHADKARQQLPGNPEVEATINRISATKSRLELLISERKPVVKRPEYIAKKKSIEDLITEGREYFEAKDLDNAEANFAEILKRDEYNIDAMRYLRKIGDIRYNAHTYKRDATVARMMDDVRDSWNPPIHADVKVPEATGTQTNLTFGKADILKKRMEQMVIPEINFRQANITDVVNFLVEASQQADPDKIGINIILNLNIPGTPATTPTAAPDAGLGGIGGLETPVDAGQGGLGASAGAANVPNITLNLRRQSLYNAIKYITEVAGLRFRLEENAVIITPINVVYGTVVTRLYPVQPGIIETVVKKNEDSAAGGGARGGGGGGGGGEFIGMEGGNTTFEKGDIRKFFEDAGVPFPAGTSIAYNSSISKLIVANTPDNLEKLEQILSEINAQPSQVEIEARFVELNQNDLSELGLEWILTDDYEIAQNSSGVAPMGGTERIVMRADTKGVTQGLNFFNFDSNSGTIVPATPNTAKTGVSAIGGIARFAGVLTNPELTVVLHALDQHGATDLLSAPRVTTRSGVNAQIQVVREIIYPTEFESTQPQFSNGNGLTQVVTPPLVTPGSFETREVGVILNVTPTVGPDGYSIDLVLAPEVSELEGWINYGSTFGDFTFNIPQPIFATRRMTTTIVVWDGQTVVMGGLIREQLTKTKDKIPLLGDLPLIGRLFRVEGEFSQKKNLLIFVTARLVDPSGKPIHSASAVGVETAPGTTVTTK